MHRGQCSTPFGRSFNRSKTCRLNGQKACGFDNIHPFVLKACASVFTKTVSMVFKDSVQSAIVPDAWKLANITPIFKKGSFLDPANYRPVLLTSVLSKELEKVIREAMTEHIKRCSFLSNAQHGFVAARGCLSNLLLTRLIEHLLEATM